MVTHYSHRVKTTIALEKDLLDKIDKYNPFPTRKQFLDQACEAYLRELRRRVIDDKLAAACSEAAAEDSAINEEWEAITLESWK